MTSQDASAAFKLWKRGQKLGEGTFGEVYIATHEHTGDDGRALITEWRLNAFAISI